MKINTIAGLCSSAGTIADRELQPMFQRPATLVAILVLAPVLLLFTQIEFALDYYRSRVINFIMNLVVVSFPAVPLRLIDRQHPSVQ